MKMHQERDVRKLFESYGFDVLSVHRNGHWIVKASINGFTRTFSVSVSPSDSRGVKNFESLLRRIARDSFKPKEEIICG